jgi:dienelactone hydrolase
MNCPDKMHHDFMVPFQEKTTDYHPTLMHAPCQLRRPGVLSLLRICALAGLVCAGGCSTGDCHPQVEESAGGLRQFEPALTAEALTRNGAYTVQSYAVTLPAGAMYPAGTVYYPSDGKPPFGGIAICPGFRETQAEIDWWGPRLASHGFVVLTIDVKNRMGDLPPARSEQLMAALETLRAENSQRNGALFGQVDPRRLAVMGHSMGGGAALIAAEAYGTELKAAIPFMPWCRAPKAFSKIIVPTLIIAGENDKLAAVTRHARAFYASIPTSTHKMYLEIKGGHHGVANGSADGTFTSLSRSEGCPTEEQRQIISRYVISWLKLFVDGDERYRQFIYEELPPGDASLFSKVEMAP